MRSFALISSHCCLTCFGVSDALPCPAIEDVRMAADQLVGDRLDRVGDREAAFFLADLRQEHRLEQEVAELVLERVVIVAIERVEQLVGFLQHERPQRLQRLLPIPRAAVLGAQRAHDLDELLKARSSVS